MPQVIGGPRTWEGTRDDEGQREYTIVHLVRANLTDGPMTVMFTPGLPLTGAAWAVGSDSDPWATVTPYMKASYHSVKEGGNYIWRVEQKATTKPIKRCQDNSIESPLDEPPKLSGSFVTYQREETHNRFGQPIRTSSYEMIKGSGVEFDRGKPSVKVQMNVTSLPLSMFAQYMDPPHVNDALLWGLNPRCVKLTRVEWERNFYGTCTVYYTITYEFEISYATFDRDLLDEGYKHLAAGGDPTSPKNFIVFKDKKGENARCILDGFGSLWLGGIGGTVNDVAFGSPIDGVGKLDFETAKHGLVKGDTFKILWDDPDPDIFGLRYGITVTEVSGATVSIKGGFGEPLPAVSTAFTTGSPGMIHVERYPEANLLLLGIPTTLA